MAKGSKICGLYILDGSIIIGHVFVASQNLIDKYKLWHLRLRSVSERCLFELVKQGLLGSQKLNKLEFYDNRILG